MHCRLLSMPKYMASVFYSIYLILIFLHYFSTLSSEMCTFSKFLLINYVVCIYIYYVTLTDGCLSFSFLVILKPRSLNSLLLVPYENIFYLLLYTALMNRNGARVSASNTPF